MPIYITKDGKRVKRGGAAAPKEHPDRIAFDAMKNATSSKSDTLIKKDGIENIRSSIENLLSDKNLANPDSVGVLQDKLNKYVHGEDKLKVDRILGPKTTKSIRQFQNESRYWGGHETIDIDPERTYRRYKGVETGQYNREGLPEGGGDMGPY